MGTISCDGVTPKKVWEDYWQQLPTLGLSRYFQRIQEEIDSQGISKVKDIWRDQEDDQDLCIWVRKEWWEHFSPGEEVERLEESLNNRHVRTHPGDDKLQWGYTEKGSFTMKESYDILTKYDTLPTDKKWGNLWKKKLWPKISICSWLLMRN